MEVQRVGKEKSNFHELGHLLQKGQGTLLSSAPDYGDGGKAMAHEKLLCKTPILSSFNFSPVQVCEEIFKKNSKATEKER